MAIDRLSSDPDAAREKTEPNPPAERCPPPPDQPGIEGFPSRADSRRGAAAANNTDRQPAVTESEISTPPGASEAAAEPRRQESGRSLDESIGGDDDPEADRPEFTPEQLAELREAEEDIRGLAEKHGVRIDTPVTPSTRPTPEN